MSGLLALLLPLAALEAPPAPREAPVAGLYAAPAPGEAAAEFRGYLSSWVRVGQGIPRPLLIDRPVALTVRLPRRPGEAAAASSREDLDGLGVGISVYAVCPADSAVAADGSCAQLYFQIQTVLSGTTTAFCGAALSKRDALPFPVVQCAAPETAAGGRMLGVTLHRTPFLPAT